VSVNPSSVKGTWTLSSPAPAAQSIQVTTTSTASVTLTIKANQAWIVPSATSLAVSSTKPGTLSIGWSSTSVTAAGTYTGSISVTGSGISQTIPVTLEVTAAATQVKGGLVTVVPLFLDGAGTGTAFTLVNPYPTTTATSISFLSTAGTAITVPIGTTSMSWQNITIPAFGSTTISTTGTSSPQKAGMALIQTSDATKRVRAWAQIANDVVAPMQLMASPFLVPFDATGSASTTLYFFNPAGTGTVAMNLSVYDTAGTLVGTGLTSIPAQQEGTLPMTRTAAVFGGRKGTLLVTPSASVSAMGLRTATDGRISSSPPAMISGQ